MTAIVTECYSDPNHMPVFTVHAVVDAPVLVYSAKGPDAAFCLHDIIKQMGDDLMSVTPAWYRDEIRGTSADPAIDTDVFGE